VRLFDFEERLTNPLEIPDGWIRAQHDEVVPRIRPDFPIWNQGELDYSFAWRGEGSVRLGVAGGSASLRLQPGVLPIFPLGEYAVRAMVRTEKLTHSRPRLALRALDVHGRPVPGSERSTVIEPLSNDWQLVEVRLPGLFEDAAYLQIDLELVQAREFGRAVAGEHQVWQEDFDGVAWFDEVAVIQMPQVTLACASPLGVVTRPDRPVLHADVRDLAAEQMHATLRVYDSDRRLLDTQERAITTGRIAWDWSPRLTDLGWYRASIDVSAEGRLISSETCDFIWVETAPGAEPRYDSGPQFSGAATAARSSGWRPMALELTALPAATPDELAGAFRAVGASWVSLPVWEPELGEGDMPRRIGMLADAAGAMREAWIETAFSLPRLPDELAAGLRLDPAETLAAVTGESAAWEPFLLGAMDRLGTVATSWQLGASGTQPGMAAGELAARTAEARSRLSGLVPGVELSLGWRLDATAGAAAAAGADAVALGWPAWMARPPFEQALAPWRDQAGVFPMFVLQPLETDRHTERDAAADLVRRVTELWRVASDVPEPRFRAALRDPWRLVRGEKSAAHPTVALAAWRSAADRLGGRTFAHEWPLVKGVRCIVFVPRPGEEDRGGVIAAWNETAAPEDAELIATLSKGPVRVHDIFGNEREVPPTSSEDGARLEHRIAIGPEPVFIEGIDTKLVLFLTSVALDPPEIQSMTGEHEHAVVVRNPWDTPASGRVIVSEPGGYDIEAQARDRSWEITPRTLAFDVPAGGEVRLPIVVSFSRSTEAGAKSFVFDVHVVADEDYGWVRARSYAELTWNDVWLDVTFRPAEEGPRADLIVEATVTNTGERARSFEAVAFAPGLPRVRSSIGTLQPGQSVVRRFPFPGAYDALGGQRVIVSLAEPDAPGRLTKAVEIPLR